MKLFKIVVMMILIFITLRTGYLALLYILALKSMIIADLSRKGGKIS